MTVYEALTRYTAVLLSSAMLRWLLLRAVGCGLCCCVMVWYGDGAGVLKYGGFHTDTDALYGIGDRRRNNLPEKT